MTKIVKLQDAKANLSQLIREVEAGETVIVTRHGKPAVQLVRPQAIPPGSSLWDALRDSPRAAGPEEELPLSRDGGPARRTPFEFEAE